MIEAEYQEALRQAELAFVKQLVTDMESGALTGMRATPHPGCRHLVGRPHSRRKGTDLGTWGLWMPMALAGIGLGLLVVPLIDIALSTVSPDDAGAASGTFSTFQQLGGALDIAIIGVLFFNAVGDVFSPDSLRDGLVAASRWSVGGYLVCAESTLLLPDRCAVHEAARRQEELLSL